MAENNSSAPLKTAGVSLAQHRANRIYVAGPMTGLPDFNFPAFNTAANELRAEGWHVENPAEHGIVDGAQRSDYMHTDLQQLSTCCAIYLLPGWSKSRGATLEAHVAQALGMAVYYAPNAENQAVAAQAPAAVAVPDQIAFLNEDRDGWIEAHAKLYRLYHNLRDAADDLLTCVMHDGALIDPEHPKRIAVEAVRSALAGDSMTASEIKLPPVPRNLVAFTDQDNIEEWETLSAIVRGYARNAVRLQQGRVTPALPATEDSSAGDAARCAGADARETTVWTANRQRP